MTVNLVDSDNVGEKPARLGPPPRSSDHLDCLRNGPPIVVDLVGSVAIEIPARTFPCSHTVILISVSLNFSFTKIVKRLKVDGKSRSLLIINGNVVPR